MIYEKAMTHIGPPNRASEPYRKLKFSTFENPRWRSLTDEHLTKQHWQPVFLFSKPIVCIHVCCLYIELSRSKLHKTGDLQVGNWHVNCQHVSIHFISPKHGSEKLLFAVRRFETTKSVWIRYDTVDLRALKSWWYGQLNLAHGPKTKK